MGVGGQLTIICPSFPRPVHLVYTERLRAASRRAHQSTRPASSSSSELCVCACVCCARRSLFASDPSYSTGREREQDLGEDRSDQERDTGNDTNGTHGTDIVQGELFFAWDLYLYFGGTDLPTQRR